MIDQNSRTARRHSVKRDRPKTDPTDSRSYFQKDRDRVLYTSSLRRLAEITQVVSADTSHVFHNRLTHSMQVSQVGRRLAERLLLLDHGIVESSSTGLDPDVVEAACLAHDLGHPPFGHIAEEELNDFAGNEIDGFEGNAQSFRIVTRLSQHSTHHRGLDLTRATLAAILKYPWLKGNNPSKSGKWGAYRSEQKNFDFACELPGKANKRTIEAELMDWADDITYSVHDLEDFYRAGKIPLHLLADRLYERERRFFFENVFERVDRNGGSIDREASIEAFNDLVIGLFPLDRPYSGTWQERAALRNFSSQLIGRYISGTRLKADGDGDCVPAIDEQLRIEVAILKELTWTYIIEAPALVTKQFGQRRVIRGLCEIFFEAANDQKRWYLFPPYYRDSLKQSGGDPKIMKRTVVDFVAGMTENQALAMFARLSGLEAGTGLHEIVP